MIPLDTLVTTGPPQGQSSPTASHLFPLGELTGVPAAGAPSALGARRP